METPIDTKTRLEAVRRPDNVNLGVTITIGNARYVVDLYRVENSGLSVTAIISVEVSRFTIVFEHGAERGRRRITRNPSLGARSEPLAHLCQLTSRMSGRASGRSPLANVRLDAVVMFHAVKSKNPAPFGTGMMLADEEHEQEDDDLDQLLVAQLKLDCQCYHGLRLDYAGRPANWLRVGIWRRPGYPGLVRAQTRVRRGRWSAYGCEALSRPGNFLRAGLVVRATRLSVGRIP